MCEQPLSLALERVIAELGFDINRSSARSADEPEMDTRTFLRLSERLVQRPSEVSCTAR